MSRSKPTRRLYCSKCKAKHFMAATCAFNSTVTKPPINTHVRLFDLVRFMRSELHQADLITDEEYAWLCMEAPLAKGGGSPPPRRLEDYDTIREKFRILGNGVDEALRRMGSNPQAACVPAASALRAANAAVNR